MEWIGYRLIRELSESSFRSISQSCPQLIARLVERAVVTSDSRASLLRLQREVMHHLYSHGIFQSTPFIASFFDRLDRQLLIIDCDPETVNTSEVSDAGDLTWHGAREKLWREGYLPPTHFQSLWAINPDSFRNYVGLVGCYDPAFLRAIR